MADTTATGLSDQLGLLKLLTSGRDTYQATREAIKSKTAGEEFSGGLVEATKDIPQNTFAGGLVKGLASGYDLMEKKKGATKREEITARLQEIELENAKYNQAMDAWLADYNKKKLTSMQADEELRNNGKVLADSLQMLELGDETGFRNFLAANQNVANMLGDDGPGGIVPDGGRIVTRDGKQFVQAYGKGPNGEPWAGREIPLSGILQAYAPDVYAARSEKALTEAKASADLQKTQAEINKLNEDARKSGAEANQVADGKLDPSKAATVEKALRDDFQAQSKDFATISDFYQRGHQGFKEGQAGNGSGDMKLVFSYMKLLDPTSVVREGEYANAASVGSVPDRIVQQYNNILNGNKLGPDARQNILQAMESAFADKAKQQLQNEENYKAMSERSRVDPRNVMIGIPTVGQISPSMVMGNQGTVASLIQGGSNPAQNAAPQGIVQVSTPEDYAKLPSGTQYTAPDGSVRVKK